MRREKSGNKREWEIREEKEEIVEGEEENEREEGL